MDCQKLIIYGLVALVGLYFLRETCGLKLPFIDNMEGFLGFDFGSDENNGKNNGSLINGNVNANNNNNAVLPSTTGQKVSPSEEHGDESFLRVAGLNNRKPASCLPDETLLAKDLLPGDNSNAYKDFDNANPAGEGILKGVNFLKAGFHVGVNSVGQSLRNANRQIRSEPPNPQVAVSPWQNTTIGPDLGRKPLDDEDICVGGSKHINSKNAALDVYHA